MNWLALSPAEIAVVWAGLAAAALWLYLHHRRPQHRKVSTLRFWASVQPIAQPRRRKLREPWAFLAQILFLLLLVLALANPRWGPAIEGRSVVIVFDASIWSQAHPAGEPAWIDRERAEAMRVLDSLPGGDRVLLLRAEADAPPILPFTTDRAALRRAILTAQPSSVAADLPRALEMGRAALGGARRGLLVYVGPGLVDAEQARSLDEFRAEVESPDNNGAQPQFLMRLVGDWDAVQNRGITRLSLRRDAAQPDRWRLLTQLKNYSNEKADVVLAFSVNGQPIGKRKLSLAPEALANAEDEFTWDQGGMLQAEISPSDALQADDRATVNIPTFRTVRVAVFASGASPFAADLLSVLSSNPYVQAQILPPELSANISPDVAIYQGANLPAQPDFNSIWFLSGPAGCRVQAAARDGMEPAASGDAVGPHARHQRAQSRRAESPARRYRSRLHRGKPAGAADCGARTRRAQNSDHRLQSARFQFSAGVGVPVADGRERRVDDAFRRRSCGLALHGRDRSSRSGDENHCAVRKRSSICAQRRGRSSARVWKPECTGSSGPAAKRALP